MEINGNGAGATTSFKEEKLDPADFWEEPQDDMLDEVREPEPDIQPDLSDFIAKNEFICVCAKRFKRQ